MTFYKVDIFCRDHISSDIGCGFKAITLTEWGVSLNNAMKKVEFVYDVPLTPF